MDTRTAATFTVRYTYTKVEVIGRQVVVSHDTYATKTMKAKNAETAIARTLKATPTAQIIEVEKW